MTGYVEKNVYRIGNILDSQDDFTHQHQHPLAFNHKCYQILKRQKDLITHYNQSKKWDKYKKFMNDYELVFTSSSGFPNISKHSPISRSFFKLWEILHDFKDELPFSLNDATSSIKACGLAEGPGGFIEALVKYRKDVVGAPASKSEYYGMTLMSQNRNVPNWKFSREFIRSNNIRLCYGDDGTGSLYNMSNINSICSMAGEHDCDIVTSDGGFDYSNDFNEQEDASLPLIMCETLAAVRLQKRGGAFILKIFDISQPRMFQLLYFLYMMYEGVYFVKPFSSRPANSEKYVVCCGFRGPNPTAQQALQDAISTVNKPINLVPITFIKEIVHYNTYYTINQTISIMRTLEFIDACETKGESVTHAKIKKQIECAMRWCHKYKLPISILSLVYYKKYV